MRRWLGAVLGMVAALAAGLSSAADYPNKPIRWIIDFPPAGVSDILTRTVGQKLTEYLGQAFVYDNRPGANGVIANEPACRTIGPIACGHHWRSSSFPLESLRRSGGGWPGR